MRLLPAFDRFLLHVSTAIFLVCLCTSRPAHAQLSTDDHLAEPGFWPTKNVKSLEEFAGSAACAECHRTIAASQFQTSMARGLLRANESKFLASPTPLQFVHGDFHYQIQKVGDKVLYTASEGTQKRTSELLWAFGTGRVAQSYLFKTSDGSFHEALVTFFTKLKNLHVTPAREISDPKDLSEAIQRRVPDSEVRRCFACHSTRAIIDDQFEETSMIPGVACEACHGPGAKHVAAMQAAKLAGVTPTQGEFIFNPARLGPADSVDFCGACHNTWWDIKLTGVKGVANVRAQPYRLESSKCWGSGDARLRCAACHDPHAEVSTDAASYDAACLACHRSSSSKLAGSQPIQKACPVAAKNCTTCHMPKVEIPFMHDTFTDHKIQIAKPGAPYVD